MTEVITKYLPSKWLDERVPEPQADVAAFLHPQEDGTWKLGPVKDEIYQDDEADAFYWKSLTAGETVTFSEYEDFEYHVMDVEADGSVSAETVPEKANHFQLADNLDSLATSVEELAAMGEDGMGPALQPGSYDIHAYWWSEYEVLFRFDIVEGKGQFTRVGMTQ